MRDVNLASEYAKRLAEIGGLDETLAKFVFELDVLEQLAYHLKRRSVEPIVTVTLSPMSADALRKIVQDQGDTLRVLVFELGRRVSMKN